MHRRRKSSGSATQTRGSQSDAGVKDSDDCNIKSDFDFDSVSNGWIPFILAVGLRFGAYAFLGNYLSASVEFTTPWNSFKRLKEAVIVTERYDISPYEGDSFHLMPLLLYFLGPLTYFQTLFVSLTIIADICVGVILHKVTLNYLQKLSDVPSAQAVQCAKLVQLMYFFNPMSIGCAAVGSISVFLNLLVATFILSVSFDQIYIAAVLNVITIFIYPYYVVLLGPLFAVARNRRLTTLAVVFATTGSLFALNCSIERASVYVPDTFYYFWSVDDLTPNVGIFWYFFVFIFEQYRSAFLWAFQLSAVVPAIPLSVTLQNDPMVLVFACLGHLTVLSSYPSLAEATVPLAMYAMFPHIVKYARYTLIGFSTIVVVQVLFPIMWSLWMVTGSGNANFYFASVMAYNLALSFLIVDIMYGYVRHQFVKTAEQHGVENAEEISQKVSIKGIIAFVQEPLPELEKDSSQKCASR